MTDFMSDNSHYFIVVHHFHQSAANTDTTVATGKSIYVNNIVYLKIQIQSVNFDILCQTFQTLSHLRIGAGHFIMGIHPFDIFTTHGHYIGITKCDSLSNIGSGANHFLGVNCFPSDFKLRRSSQADTSQQDY